MKTETDLGRSLLRYEQKLRRETTVKDIREKNKDILLEILHARKVEILRRSFREILRATITSLIKYNLVRCSV